MAEKVVFQRPVKSFWVYLFNYNTKLGSHIEGINERNKTFKN